jgi:hypothetical protein
MFVPFDGLPNGRHLDSGGIWRGFAVKIVKFVRHPADLIANRSAHFAFVQ